MKSNIDRILSQSILIRPVYLNRVGNMKGTLIGKLIRFPRGTPFGKMFYFTTRTGEHYYRKDRGFACDSLILKRLVMEELDSYRNMTDDALAKIRILLLYEGKRVRKLLVAEPDDFFEHDTKIEYTKDTGECIESYGQQNSLSENLFKLWVEEKQKGEN